MQLGIFNIPPIAFFAVPSLASMLEVFHGASCDEEPTGITQMLYASHAGYTFCGTAEDYGVNLVVRSGEEPDNPDWPYCEWSFFSDPFCEDLIVSLNPEGHTCACALLPAFKTFKIDCYGEPWKRRRRQRQRRNATIPYLSEPSYAMNQSLTSAQAWGNTCDRPITPFRVGLTFASGQMHRSAETMMIDKFEVLQHGDPEFVGNIFHAAHQEIYPIFTNLEKLWRVHRVVTVTGPLKTKIEFTLTAAEGYALGTSIDVINPERLPRVFYILFYTMRRQGMRAVKFRLTSVHGGDDSHTPIMSVVVRVLSSVP